MTMSKYVYLRRAPSRLRIPPELLAVASRKVGSSFGKGNSLLRGLTLEEESKYLPVVIGISANSPDFARKAYEFWANLNIEVPAGEGVKLNVSTTADGTPESLMDWIYYKFCVASSDVANDEKALHGQPRAHFFLFDADIDKQRKVDEMKGKMEARTAFLRISKDIEKLRFALQVARPDITVNTKDDDEVLMLMDREVDNKPQQMLTIISDKNLEGKAFILQLLSTQVLSKIGNTIYHAEMAIGDNLDQAAVFIKDPKNSKVFITLQEQYKAYATA